MPGAPTLLGSSMVEHAAVNRRVVGSSPTRGALSSVSSLQCGERDGRAEPGRIHEKGQTGIPSGFPRRTPRIFREKRAAQSAVDVTGPPEAWRSLFLALSCWRHNCNNGYKAFQTPGTQDTERGGHDREKGVISSCNNGNFKARGGSSGRQDRLALTMRSPPRSRKVLILYGLIRQITTRKSRGFIQ